MAGRIRDRDWDATPLGPIACWPQSLKTIVDVMLSSPSMMSLVWGAEAIHLYNDRFTELLREHHAQALGQSAFVTFARSRDVFAADIAAGMSGRSARLLAQKYPVLRNGELKDAWFDVDYAPVSDEAGKAAGVLWTLKEVTAQVLADRALRESEARHRLLIGSWAQAVWETDPNGVVVTDSPSWRTHTGQTLEEWLGYGWLDAIHPDDKGYAERQWRDAIAAQRFVDAEFRLRAPDSGWHWTNVRAAPVIDADGQIEKWLGLNIDIDARKQAEEALRALQQRQSFLLELTDSLKPIFDAGAMQRTTTRLVAEHLGVDRTMYAEVAGNRGAETGLIRAQFVRHAIGVEAPIARFPDNFTFDQFGVHTMAARYRSEPLVVRDVDHDPAFSEAERAAWQKAGVRAAIVAPLAKDGRLVAEFGVHCVESRNWTDEEVNLVQEVAERTWAAAERARAERALRQSEERYRSLFNVVRQGLAINELVRDSDGRVVDAWYIDLNPAYEEQTGFSRIKAIGRLASEIFPLVEPFWLEMAERVVMSGKPERIERFVADTGSWFSFDMAPYGGTDQFVVLYDNITDRKQAEAARRQNEEQQVFLLNLSDAVRPLADPEDIQGETTRLLREALDAGWCHYVDWDLDQKVGLVLRDSVREGLPSLAGAHDVSDAPEFLQLLAVGETLTVRDYATYEQLPARIRQNFTALGFRSMMAAPLIKEGCLIATLLVGDTKVRDWSASETSLLVEAAERTWATLERARAEAALRESEQRFQEFAKASAFGLWIRDADTLAMEYTSPAITGIYGLEPGALLGDVSRWIGTIHPEDRDAARQHLDQARQGETIVHEFRIRRASDQAVRWIRNTDFPLYDGGQVQRIGGIAEDITEARAIQQELAHGAERLRNAVEVGGVGLWDWNIVTGEVHWSEEHFRLQGYAAGEVAPSYEAWASRLHPDDRAGAEAALRQAMADHQEFLREFRAVHPDASIHWHSARGRFFYDDRGEPVRMIGAMVDTTERREWEEWQKVLVNELQHRTRNLMGVVRTMSDKTARASTDLSDFRARFRDRLEALSRVQGLLSRLEDHDRVTFDDLIRTELAIMDGTADRVTLSGPEGIRLRSSTVQTLAMALHELTTNAMKYGALGQPAGRLAITWSLQHDGDKPWLHIDWRESGVSMAPTGAAPRGTGQGRELIEKALPYQLKAKTSYTLGPDGVHCTIAVPVSATPGKVEDHG